jgi:hypothetical protein
MAPTSDKTADPTHSGSKGVTRFRNCTSLKLAGNRRDFGAEQITAQDHIWRDRHPSQYTSQNCYLSNLWPSQVLQHAKNTSWEQSLQDYWRANASDSATSAP